MTKKEEQEPKTAPSEPTKSSLPSLILKVLIAPSRAFAEIKEAPKYLGPFLIMLLFIGANTGFLYVYASKIQVEQIMPTLEHLDQWTENATMWTSASGVNITENFEDSVNGSYYGNRSIEFSTLDSIQLPATLNNIGPVNCYGSDGYTELSIRIRLNSPAVVPQNMSVYLFSASVSDYFYYNSSEAFANFTTNAWNNLTFPLGTDEWASSGLANWSSVSGLKLELTWPANSSITVLIDGLFFHGVFKTPMEMLGNAYVLNFGVISMTQFVIQWAVLCGLIYVVTKAFGAKTFWKPLLVAIGFVLITMLIQAIANAALFSTLPQVRYPFSFLGGVEGEGEAALTKIMDETSWVNMISSYIRMGVYAWIIVLCGVAVKQLTEFSLTKSLLISAAAFFASIMLSYMLGI
jgi:hypothetical protein